MAKKLALFRAPPKIIVARFGFELPALDRSGNQSGPAGPRQSFPRPSAGYPNKTVNGEPLVIDEIAQQFPALRQQAG